jgi:hypothetical protein
VDGKPVVSAPVPADWWRLYQDPRLDQLVQQAMASNTDLRVAAANLSRARAQVDEAEAAGGWSGGVKMGAQRLQESGQAFLLPEKVPVANIGDIGISASYQFDLFGTLQRGIEAAKANADATQAAPTPRASPWWRMWFGLHPSVRGQRRAGNRPAFPRPAIAEHHADPALARCRAWR